MKQFILCTFILFCSFSAAAQTEPENEPKHVVGLQVGGAFVNGNFGEAGFEDAYPAFARNGLLLTGSYRYNLGKHLAAGASVSLRHNRYDLDAFADPDDELVIGKSSEAWSSVFTLADVYALFPVEQLLEVYLKGSVGASFNRSASWQVQTTYGDIHMPADKATAFALGWGSGIGYNLHPFLVTVEAGMLHTEPVFTVLNTQGTPIRHRQPMNTFHVSLGVQFTL